MIAVILAAGMARRLRPLTDTMPKCLLKIGDKSLLQRSVDSLISCGINEFVVVTGYRSRMITDFLKDNYTDKIFHFVDNDDYDTTNNIYSLWLAMPYVKGKDFLLLDSDILYDSKLLDKVMEEECSALCVNRHELGDEEMKVVVDSNNVITEISKTCSLHAAMGESVGVEKINADYSLALYDELEIMETPENPVDIFYERAFERLIPKGYSFKVVDTTDIFSTEIDTVEDYEMIRKEWNASK